MQRRTFVSGLTAALALGAHNAVAQRSGTSSTVVTSEFTGATIDFTDSGLELLQLHVDSAEGVEHAHFNIGEGNRFDICFFPTEFGDSADYVTGIYNMWAATMPDQIELFDEQSIDDGGWMIWTVGGERLAYYEYQYGAYPNHDLVIFLEVEIASFVDVFNQAQLVTVDDLAPMLFDADSAIVSVAEEVAAGTASTTTSTRNTNSRSTRSSKSTPANETESTTTGGGAVEGVLAHRKAFWESYDRFLTLLEIVVDDTATSTDSADAWAGMANIALEWQLFPATAAELDFSASETDLEISYLSWADLVGEMGVTFEQYFIGTVPVDDFLDLVDEFELVDAELAQLLEGYGGIRHNNWDVTRSAAIDLHALGQPLHLVY